MTDLLGYAAGVLTTGSALPQVLKNWRNRSVRDLSLVMLVMLNLGLGLWVAYGIDRGEWPIILTNGVSLALWSSLLWLKLTRRQEPPAC